MCPRRSGEWANDSSFREVTLDARHGRSSGAAKSVKEALLRCDDARDVGRLWRRIKFVDLERAAENDPVRPWKHIAEIAKRRVLNLWLRLEDGELAARGMHVLVVEKVAAAKAGAVEDEVLWKRRDIAWRREPAHFDLAARNSEVSKHLAKVAPGLHV